MTTTFVLGNTTIAKDMVFGWVIRSFDGKMAILSQESSLLLQQLLSQSYPAYMQGFVEDCNKYLQEALKREAQTEVDRDAVKAMIPVTPTKIDQAKMRRQAEILGMKGYLEDMFKTRTRVEIDYGSDRVYAIAKSTVTKDSDNKDVVWYGLYTVANKDTKELSSEGYVSSHSSLQELAQSVCNRWW